MSHSRRAATVRLVRDLPLAAFATLLAAACNDSVAPRSPDVASRPLLSDVVALHSAPGFAFLPPLAPHSAPIGEFDGSLAPVVTVCRWAEGACEGGLVAEFTIDGRRSERLRVDLDDEHYIVTWHTESIEPAVLRTYRVRVVVAGAELGHANVVLVRNARQKREVDPALGLAIVAGSTLPIKFRIEKAEADAGALYALSYEGEFPNGVQRLIRIDPVTGAVSVAATIPGVHWVSDAGEVDPRGSWYFFYGGDAASFDASTRYAVNVRTGEIRAFGTRLSWPPVNEAFWQFDVTTGLLYALSYMGEPPTGTQRIVSIDPATGAVSVVATVPGVHLVSESAFDEATGRFFFYGADLFDAAMTRYSVNVRTGEVRTFGTQLTWPPTNEHGWHFDAASGALYALSYDGEPPTGTQRIVRIDPASGSLSVAATVPGVHWVSGHTYDPGSGRYFFYGSGDPVSDWTRYSVNVRTGAVHTFGTMLQSPTVNEVGWAFIP